MPPNSWIHNAYLARPPNRERTQGSALYAHTSSLASSWLAYNTYPFLFTCFFLNVGGSMHAVQSQAYCKHAEASIEHALHEQQQDTHEL